MKITREYLKKVIKEELNKLEEMDGSMSSTTMTSSSTAKTVSPIAKKAIADNIRGEFPGKSLTDDQAFQISTIRNQISDLKSRNLDPTSQKQAIRQIVPKTLIEYFPEAKV